MPTLQSLIALFGIGALSLHFLQNRQTLVSQPSGDTLILTLANPIDPILEQFESKIFSSREEKATAIKEALTTATSEWHAPVHALLKPLGVETTSFWATNKVLVRGSTPLIENVIRTFDSSIEIWKNAVIPLLPTFDLIEGTPPDGPEWNINNIGAPEVWDGGFLGQGVLVASIDTGVHWTHEALIGGFNEENGWFDPIFGFPFPVDTNGHGTHTMGTICGSNGIGVAPKAKWMTCVGCSTAGCPMDALLTCGQFVACPSTSTTGGCAGLPRVVSNSWGGGQGDDFYKDIIKLWHMNNIVPVFAIGNSGPECNTANSPGDNPGVISVGSTDITNTISSFSSRGPRKNGNSDVAPLIVAPGGKINSASNVKDNAYQVMSGTSMATPHVAGSSALLISKNQGLTFTALQSVLFGSASRDVTNSNPQACGNIRDDRFPNDVFENGRLKVNKAAFP